jgi:uncharacterized membrane protein YphA (DoxX/SURF4 family)
MQRLFSGFPDGWAGTGILVLRLSAGVPLVCDGIAGLCATPQIGPFVRELVSISAGVLLLAGLWTPLAGTLTATLQIWSALAGADQLRAVILLATVGTALAMVGPGAWSADAHLFGRKRIDIPSRRGCPPLPLK